jgi:hypothetical protein
MKDRSYQDRIEQLETLVESLSAQLSEYLQSPSLTQEWYTLEEACALKGTSSKTARNQPWLQPNGGTADAIVGRKRRWHRNTIREWLGKTDAELSP